MAALTNRTDAKEKPSGMAILLSAVVFPGAGQYLQGRRLTGTFYLLTFLFCVVFLFKAIFKPLLWDLRVLSDFPGPAEVIAFYPDPWKNILLWAAVSVFVYLANLLDVFVFYRQGLGRHENVELDSRFLPSPGVGPDKPRE